MATGGGRATADSWWPTAVGGEEEDKSEEKTPNDTPNAEKCAEEDEKSGESGGPPPAKRKAKAKAGQGQDQGEGQGESQGESPGCEAKACCACCAFTFAGAAPVCEGQPPPGRGVEREGPESGLRQMPASCHRMLGVPQDRPGGPRSDCGGNARRQASGGRVEGGLTEGRKAFVTSPVPQPVPLQAQQRRRQRRAGMPLSMCVRRPLQVGADCAGMGTDVVALKRLAVPFEHTFMSETNRDCRSKLLKRMAAPQRLFRTMCPEKAEAVDVYTCGFPCQPYRA